MVILRYRGLGVKNVTSLFCVYYVCVVRFIFHVYLVWCLCLLVLVPRPECRYVDERISGERPDEKVSVRMLLLSLNLLSV